MYKEMRLVVGLHQVRSIPVSHGGTESVELANVELVLYLVLTSGSSKELANGRHVGSHCKHMKDQYSGCIIIK